MTTLIIGPSNSGKSTYIEQSGLTPAHFAYELTQLDVPASGFLHYNLLHYALALRARGELEPEWDLVAEPLLSKIIGADVVERAIVIVAPINELIVRASHRKIVESSREIETDYPVETWLSILKFVDLFALYERLFDLMEAHQIPYDVLYSSDSFPIFLASDRTYVHHNLRGVYISLPGDSAVDEVVSLSGAEYQDVLLPDGRSTSKGAHSHLSSSRGDTFRLFREQACSERSVLDIGCALGDMLYRTERYGATKLVGVEKNYTRYAAALAVKELLHSRVTLLNADFFDLSFDEQFDDVLALNILHHVSDVHRFLNKAANLAAKRLIVEYPNLQDAKFGRLGALPPDLTHLPIIAVSHKSVDQTFVYTLPAVERIISEAGQFEAEAMLSPIPNRDLVVFHRI